MIRERTRSATSVTRSRGERISGHAPFGWDFGLKGLLVENAGEQRSLPGCGGCGRKACHTGASRSAWPMGVFDPSGASAGFIDREDHPGPECSLGARLARTSPSRAIRRSRRAAGLGGPRPSPRVESPTRAAPSPASPAA
jgi:hypothetical protein